MPRPSQNKRPLVDSWRSLTRRDPQALLRGIPDASIVGVLLAAPLVMGGRDERGRLVYVMAVMVAVIVHAACNAFSSTAKTAGWRRTGVDFILIAGMALLCLQLVPLDWSTLTRLSPAMAGYLPVWSGEEGSLVLGQWSTLSLDPYATRAQAAVMLAHMLFFFLLVQRLNTTDDLAKLLKLLAVGCVGYAMLGLIQFLTSNGKFLWVYDHPYRTTDDAVKGPFINQNHFAHLLALGIAPCVWWLQSVLPKAANGERQAGAPHKRKHPRHGRPASPPGFRRPASRTNNHAAIYLTMALAAVALAAFLTFSRGGTIALMASTTAIAGLYLWKSHLSWRYASILGLTAVVVLLGLAIFGGDRLGRELSSIGTGDLEEIDHNAARRDLWMAALTTGKQFPLTGTGLGSHEAVYRLQYERYAAVHFTHAESGYLQIFMECGIPGLLLLSILIALFGYWSLTVLRTPDRKLQAIGLAAVAGLAASLLHSAWDFVWYLPACMSWTIALAAILCRSSQLTQAGAASFSAANKASVEPPVSWSWAWASVCLAMLLVSVLAFRTLAPAAAAQVTWDAFLRHEELVEHEGESDHPDARLESLALLDATISRAPNHAKAHLAIASNCLLQFADRQAESRNRMDLMQIRSAALASRFSSRNELEDWLARAIGEDCIYLARAKQHALRAVESSPLLGHGYVFLADLAFLDGAPEAASQQLLQQAMLVRPHEGSVQFAVGSHAALQGDLQATIAHWKQAFHHDPQYRRLIVDKIAPQIAGAKFVQSFEPDLPAAKRAFEIYLTLERHADAKVLGQVYIEHLKSTTHDHGREQAAGAYRTIARVHRKLDQPQQALLAYDAAVQAMPEDFNLRREFALELLRQNEYYRAEKQLTWCLARKPGDANLKRLAIQAKRGQLESQAQNANPSAGDPPRH